MEVTIYKLTNKLNGMGYIGMTKNFKRRMKEHRRYRPRSSSYRGCRVDEIINQYGWENFTVEVIEICDAEVAPERERYWIATLKTKIPNGYNGTVGGEKFNKPSAEKFVQMSAKYIKRIVYPHLQAELNKQMITRTDLAQMLGVSQTTLSDWMKGRSEPRLSSAIKVKEVLGVDMPLEELFAKKTAQQSE